MILQRNSSIIFVLFFLSFVIACAFKLAAFDNLIVDQFALQNISSGYLNKFAVLLIVSLLLTLPKRPFLFAAFYFLQAIYLYVNLLYHFGLMGYLHVGQYAGLSGEALDLARHSAVPFDGRLAWVLLDVPFFIGILATYGAIARVPASVRLRIGLYGLAAVLLVFFTRWDSMRVTANSLMKDAYESDISVVGKYGLLTFNIVDLVNYRDGQNHISAISYGPTLSVPACPEGFVRPDIVVIQVESLDAYIVDRKYKERFVTPFFHELASSSAYYPYTLSYHEAGGSSDCDFSVLNGIESFDDYPAIKIRNYDYVNSVAKQLSKNGYSVEAFHGNEGSYFNRIAAFKKMGFDRFSDMDAMGLHHVGWGAPDRSVFDFIETKLRSAAKPIFYYAITMSSHEPFTFTQSYYQNNFFSDIRNARTRDYFNAISYVDREVGEFVRNVKSARPNAYIFIFGDHTPVIAKDVYKRASFVYEGKQFEFVPLFIVRPNGPAVRESRCVASFIDIAPTILAAAGGPYAYRSNGQNLLAGPIKNTAIEYRGSVYLRTDLYKRIKQGK